MNFYFLYFDEKKICGVNFVLCMLLNWLYILIYLIWCLFFMLISRFILKKNFFWIIGLILFLVVNVMVWVMMLRKIEVEWEIMIEYEYLNVMYIVMLLDVNRRYCWEEEVVLNCCVIRNFIESIEYRIYVVVVIFEGLWLSKSDVIFVVIEKLFLKFIFYIFFWNDMVIMIRF